MNPPSRQQRENRRSDEQPEESYFFRMWANADQHVPYPYVYWWHARPREGRRSHKLDSLRCWEFRYRITNEFAVHLAGEDTRLQPGVLLRENYGYRLMPVPGRFGLLTPEAANEVLERHLEGQTRRFWEYFIREIEGQHTAVNPEKCIPHFRKLEWGSLRFEQPFAAGIVEPFYKFHKAGSRCEFWVGARSGRVRHEPASA